MAGFSSARKKTDDINRIARIKAIRDAMELYNLDKGTYYQPGTGWFLTGNGYANFRGYGYYNNVVQSLEKSGYLPKEGVPVYQAGATWLAGKSYEHKIMVYSCRRGSSESYAAGVARFADGYTIYTDLHNPKQEEREKLRSYCGGETAYKAGMDYALHMGN